MGHEGNEKTDTQAKEATELLHIKEVPLVQNLSKQFIKDKIFSEWAKRGTREPTCRQTKVGFLNPDPHATK